MNSFCHARRTAFTLLELLCVIGIIAILAAMSVKVYPKVFRKAHNLERGTAEGQANIQRLIDADEGK